jgi:hypothetical protein
MNGWKKQAARALTVWCLTYATGVIILLIIRADHPFVTALLPTLATLYSNMGIVSEAVRSARNVGSGKSGREAVDAVD